MILSLFVVFFVRWVCKKIDLNTDISLRNFKYIIIFVIYFCSIFFYKDSAKKEANNFLNNYSENIELTLNKDSLVISGKFIALMKSKYFILVKKNNNTEVFVINDNDVLQAKLK